MSHPAMSEEQLKAFLEAVKADAGLQEKLRAAGDADAVVDIAKTAGFVVSADEFKQAQLEISEDELENVAGGGLRPWQGLTPADPRLVTTGNTADPHTGSGRSGGGCSN